MKNTYSFNRLLLSLALLTSLFCIFVPRHILADDVESRITSYVGQLELHSDNTATFTEEVTFEYDSSYNGQYITLGRAGKMPKGFQIEDNPKIDIITNGQKKSPQKIKEEAVKDGKKITIYNSGKSGDQVIITITWKLRNMLWVYQDIAELNWIPISDWDADIRRLYFSVSTDRFDTNAQLFAHTGFNKNQPKVEKLNQILAVRSNNLTKGTKLELHGAWDKSIFTDIDTASIIPSTHRKQFEEKEKEIEQKQKQHSFIIYVLGPVIALSFLIISLACFLYYLLRFYYLNKLPKNTRLYEPPQNLTPLQLAYNIYNISIEKSLAHTRKTGTPSFSSLVQATLMDLIDRGNIKFRIGRSGEKLEIVHLDNLSRYEIKLLEMVFGDKDKVTPDTMFPDYQQSSKSSTRQKFQEALRTVANYVRQERVDLNLPIRYRKISKKEERPVSLAYISYYIGIIILSLGSLFYNPFTTGQFDYSYSYIYPLLLFVAWFLGKAAQIKLNRMADRYLKKEFREEVIEWQSFSNMLRDIAHLSQTEVEGIILWNRILVYATLFGYAEKVSQTLKGRDIQLKETNLESFFFSNISTGFATGFSNVDISLNPPSSSSYFSLSSGISGGFSGGGGGGGGGSF